MKKKLRIVFNTWTGAMFQKGGGEVQLLQTKAALERMGHEVLLFDQWNPQMDVDIAHQFSTEQGTEHFVFKYKQYGVPVAISTIMWTPPPKHDYQFHRIRQLLDVSDVLFPNSEMEAKNLSAYFEVDAAKWLKSRNSISVAYSSRGTADLFRSKFNIKEPFILSVANIDRRKNTKLLSRACAELGQQLVTIGHVKDPGYFEEFKDSYPGHVHLGPIEDEHMLKSAYAACDVYALPSLCETPGIAALEAASQGAKIVITSEGCAEEYFGKEAIYVDYRSIESICKGLSEGIAATKNPELPAKVVSEYSWDVTAEEIVTGYRRLFN